EAGVERGNAETRREQDRGRDDHRPQVPHARERRLAARRLLHVRGREPPVERPGRPQRGKKRAVDQRREVGCHGVEALNSTRSAATPASTPTPYATRFCQENTCPSSRWPK